MGSLVFVLLTPLSHWGWFFAYVGSSIVRTGRGPGRVRRHYRPACRGTAYIDGVDQGVDVDLRGRVQRRAPGRRWPAGRGEACAFDAVAAGLDPSPTSPRCKAGKHVLGESRAGTDATAGGRRRGPASSTPDGRNGHSRKARDGSDRGQACRAGKGRRPAHREPVAVASASKSTARTVLGHRSTSSILLIAGIGHAAQDARDSAPSTASATDSCRPSSTSNGKLGVIHSTSPPAISRAAAARLRGVCTEPRLRVRPGRRCRDRHLGRDFLVRERFAAPGQNQEPIAPACRHLQRITILRISMSTGTRDEHQLAPPPSPRSHPGRHD